MCLCADSGFAAYPPSNCLPSMCCTRHALACAMASQVFDGKLLAKSKLLGCILYLPGSSSVRISVLFFSSPLVLSVSPSRQN